MRLLTFMAALLAATLLCLSHAFAAPPVAIGPDMPQNRLFGRMEFVEDPTHAFTLDQVRALPQDRFTVLQTDNFIRGLSASAFWLRVTLHNPGNASQEWVMQHRLPFTDFAEFWVVVDGKVVTHAIGGDRTTLAERQVKYRYPAVRHVSLPGETAQVWISIRNKYTADTHLAFSLDTSTSFTDEVAHGHILLGILYGIPLALAFSALTGWLVSRDRRFSIYALYSLSVLGSWMGMNGLLGQYLLVDMPDAVNYAVHIFFLLTGVFSATFSRDFLQTRDSLPWTDRLLRAVIWISLAAVVLRLLDLHDIVLRMTMSLVVLHAVVTPIAGVNAWRKGVVHARWYVVSQVIYSVTVGVGVLVTRLGLYSYEAFLWAELAFFGELLLLSVAQYDRMRILQRDKEAAEHRYQLALQDRNLELERQVAERTHSLEEARRHAESLSRTDDLTGLGNRRDFLERAQANGPKAGVFVLALIDLDYFKRINDTYGHPAGDAVLRDLGRIMRENTRPGDVVSRLGGEEFGVLLEVPDKERAVEVLERLRHAFSEEFTRFDGHLIEHTLSIGYTLFSERPSDKELAQRMREADQALYAAKSGGRNRVEQFAAMAA